MPEEKPNGQKNGQPKDPNMDKIKQMRLIVKEWRKSCKDTARLLKELNGILQQ